MGTTGRNGDEYERDLGHGRSDPLGSHAEERRSAAHEKDLTGWLADELDGLGQLVIVEPGAQLAEGGTYLDLDRLAEGPFTAHGGVTAREDTRFVPKRETDHETWRRLEELSREAARR